MSDPVEIRYSYKHVPTLKRFSESNAFMRLALGPFGSGKSSACVIETISRALKQVPGQDGIKRSRWLVIRNSYRQLNDSTIKTFMQWLPPQHFGNFKITDHSYTITGFEKTEIEVLFRALDRPDHIGNLLSVEATGAWVNEAREVPWTIIDALQGRVGRYPAKRDGGATWSGIYCDSNPGDTDSKMYKFFVEDMPNHPPGHAEFFQQPSGFSPKAENMDNLPSNYYHRMAVGKDPEWIKVYCKGEWGFVIDGRAVYPEYSDTAHCVEIKGLSYCPMVRGWDFGLTPSCVFTQLTPNGQLLVLDELVSDNMGADQFSDDVIAYSSQKYGEYQFIDIGDPAGAQRAQTDEKTCFQILHSKQIMIEPGLQSMQIRLESVRRPLTRLVNGKPGFQIHPRCKTLRKGFLGGYQFRRLQTSAERYTAVPDKNAYSHPHDALQYACTYYFGSGLTSPTVNMADEAEFSDYSRSEVTGY